MVATSLSVLPPVLSGPVPVTVSLSVASSVKTSIAVSSTATVSVFGVPRVDNGRRAHAGTFNLLIIWRRRKVAGGHVRFQSSSAIPLSASVNLLANSTSHSFKNFNWSSVKSWLLITNFCLEKNKKSKPSALHCTEAWHDSNDTDITLKSSQIILLIEKKKSSRKQNYWINKFISSSNFQFSRWLLNIYLVSKIFFVFVKPKISFPSEAGWWLLTKLPSVAALVTQDERSHGLVRWPAHQF